MHVLAQSSEWLRNNLSNLTPSHATLSLFQFVSTLVPRTRPGSNDCVNLVNTCTRLLSWFRSNKRRIHAKSYNSAAIKVRSYCLHVTSPSGRLLVICQSVKNGYRKAMYYFPPMCMVRRKEHGGNDAYRHRWLAQLIG